LFSPPFDDLLLLFPLKFPRNLGIELYKQLLPVSDQMSVYTSHTVCVRFFTLFSQAAPPVFGAISAPFQRHPAPFGANFCLSSAIYPDISAPHGATFSRAGWMTDTKQY